MQLNPERQNYVAPKPNSSQSSNRQIHLPKAAAQPADKSPANEEHIFQKLAHQQEDLIDEHSDHIDSIVNCIKEDMGFLQEVKDSPTEILQYIEKTKSLLAKKMESILRFQQKLRMYEIEFERVHLVANNENANNDEIFLLKNENGDDSELLD